MSSERLLGANENTTASTASEMAHKLTKRPCNLLLILLLSGGALVFVIYFMSNLPQLNQYRILKSYQQNHQPSKEVRGTRTILLWNPFFGDRRWDLPDDTIGPEYFKEQRCPVTNCDVTNNKEFLPEIEMFDAVVFHVAEAFPFLNPIPKRRSPNQQYVFGVMESPGETKHVLNDERNFYNLTMTYRLDSDILWPYMFFEDKETGAIVAPALSPPWRVVSVDSTIDEQFNKTVAGKTKFAAWFVSHCKTLSRREELTKSLQKHISVDVFGGCGTLQCPRNSSKCDRMLDNDYLFYLAFENSLCLDYVTEKFFNALDRQVIPVVFGGADYSRIAPPHSYINAENFKTVKELADYLTYLSHHPKEYASYFWWRKFYRLTVRSPFCDLCAKLNAPAAIEKVQYYADIENWWLGGSCYFEPKIKF